MKKKPNKSCSAMAILFLLLLTCSSAFAQDFESRSTSGLFVGVGVGVANRGTWVRKQTANYETGLAANLRIGFGRFLLDLEYHPNQVAHPDSAPMTGERPERYELANAMSDAWIAFARNGDPNHEGLPAWPSYDPDQRSTMLFDVPSSVANDPRREERLAWEGIPLGR